MCEFLALDSPGTLSGARHGRLVDPDKGKPVERRGRKARGLHVEPAQQPKEN